jgi:hypothetical protein
MDSSYPSTDMIQLIGALNKASDDSGKLGVRIVRLTYALVFVGILQAIATAWPYIDWAIHHHWPK